ncbi:MAG TPA: cysteine synthase CysM [Burkholderiales bacterium]|nr:cysteine synthase CysM [Burkholderiales bacterium]
MSKTVEDFIGDTPLVRLQRLPGTENSKNRNLLLAKLEGNNPAGSVKDRPAISMIRHAERRGDIKPGDTLIEPTSGNTGIALAMAAAIRGYRMVLIMPEHLSMERRQTLRAFGAEIILTPRAGGMEAARDLAERMVREKKGTMLDQFANPDNPRVHYETTGPEIWRDTEGRITHFVSSMGTTGTIMGCSRFFKENNPKIQVIGCQPQEGSQIPGIRKWPEAYLPKIYDKSRVDRLEYVSQAEAEEMTRRLAREEGIFAGISSGGAVHVALRISKEFRNAVIVTIVCDRGDRYLTTGVFPD